jgi:hypothetical protein
MAAGSHRRSKPGARPAQPARPGPRGSHTRSRRIDLSAVAFVVVPALILFGLVFAFGHWYFFLAGYLVLLVGFFVFAGRSASERR